jgi:hypothetical protein
MEREAAYWREQAQRAVPVPQRPNAGAAGTPTPPQLSEAEPTFEQFAGEADQYMAYTRALARWEARQLLAQERQQQEHSRVQQSTQARIQKHAADLAALKATTPDFENLVSIVQQLPWSDTFAEAVLGSDDSARLVLHFAQHGEAFDSLSRLSGPALYRALGKLEASLTSASTGRSVQASPQPAYTPIAPVNSAAPVSTTSDPMSDDFAFGPEYIRVMNKRDVDRRKHGARF